jgi:putative peptidoglycan lipid II flippase
MTPPTALRTAARPPLVRTALRLLPLQAALRGGEALLPVLLAACFGRTGQTDLYYLLAAYFTLAASVVTGAFQDSGAVPVLIEVRESRPDELPHVAGALLGHTWMIGAGVGAATGAVAAIFAGLSSPAPAFAVQLAVLMAAATVATSVRAFYVGLLNSAGVFHAHPIGSGLGMTLTWAVLVVGHGALGVRAIPVAMLTGEALAVVVLAELAARALGFRAAPNRARPPAVRRIFSLVRLELTGGLITRINPVIDQLMAGLAGVVGGGTIVRYAADIAALPTSILQATLFPVLLTRLAHEAKEPRAFATTTARTLAAAFALLAVMAAGLAALRHPLCALAFGHGAMDAAGVQRIADVLPWAVAGAAPFGALLVLARAHVALQNSRIMPGMGLLNSALNVTFNALFVGPLGLAGIALSTSVTYAIVAVVFWLLLPRPGRA